MQFIQVALSLALVVLSNQETPRAAAASSSPSPSVWRWNQEQNRETLWCEQNRETLWRDLESAGSDLGVGAGTASNAATGEPPAETAPGIAVDLDDEGVLSDGQAGLAPAGPAPAGPAAAPAGDEGCSDLASDANGSFVSEAGGGDGVTPLSITIYYLLLRAATIRLSQGCSVFPNIIFKAHIIFNITCYYLLLPRGPRGTRGGLEGAAERAAGNAGGNGPAQTRERRGLTMTTSSRKKPHRLLARRAPSASACG